jgi:DUF4097 and DUF4098 domain-containing protein YvlB
MRTGSFVTAALALMLASGLALSVSAQERAPREEVKTEKTLPVQGIEEIKVSVQIGPVRVFGDNPNAVQIKAVRHAEGGTADDRHRWLSETKVEIEKQGAMLTIKDVVPKSLRENWHAKNFGMGLDLELHVPSRVAMDIATGVGDVETSGLAGGLTVATGAGSVRLKQLSAPGGDVRVNTGAGNVTMDGQAEDVTVKVGAGKVSLKRMDCTGKLLTVDAGAGDVDVALRSLPSSSLKISAGTGRIHLSVPEKARADVSASSGMGSVKSEFALSSQRRNGGSFGGTLSGNLNGGGGTTISLHAGIGEIQLDRQSP